MPLHLFEFCSLCTIIHWKWPCDNIQGIWGRKLDCLSWPCFCFQWFPKHGKDTQHPWEIQGGKGWGKTGQSRVRRHVTTHMGAIGPPCHPVVVCHSFTNKVSALSIRASSHSMLWQYRAALITGIHPLHTDSRFFASIQAIPQPEISFPHVVAWIELSKQRHQHSV